tara:strand:- start:756 stop:1412 length:657 start_codon:yes stop_codon:yes gene_type:complete
MLITIDGPSGVGKGTVARIIAEKLNIKYLDSGAMYRALALYADLNNIKENDTEKLKKLLIDIHIQFIKNEDGEDKVLLNTDDVTDEIRTNEISKLASKYASIEIVRGILREMQKRMIRNKDYVAEGRDMGTYVFPEANFKFYLDADPYIRAERRALQLKEMLGIKFNIEKILNEINERDNLDKTRELCPLHPAEDAIIIDTSNLNVDEVVDEIYKKVK